MACLIDTNMFLRSIQPFHEQYEQAVSCMEKLLSQSEPLYFTSQTIREFGNVCTRSLDKKSLGFNPAQVATEVRKIESLFSFLPDSPATYTEWRRMVEMDAVSGVKVHKAHLVASMIVNKVNYLLSFNAEDFQRYQEIVALHPRSLLGEKT